MDNTKYAHVHRFWERVAIALPGSTRTVYMLPSEAQQLAELLATCCEDINSRTFVCSTFAGTEVAVADPYNTRK